MTVPLGPLALPVGSLLFILVFVLALGAAAVSARGNVRAACGAAFDVLIVGLVAARIGFVLLYFDQYSGHWLSMLDIRDRGFSAALGIPVALAFALFLAVRRTSLRRPLAVAAAVALVGSVVAQGVTRGLTGASRQGVPPVEVTRLADGATVKLAKQGAGQPRVINLWATWCPPCREEMPLLEHARQTHPEIAFQLVNQREGSRTVRDFLARFSLSAQPVFLDSFGDLARAVGSNGLPTTLFFDARGKLIDVHVGQLSRATLHRHIKHITAHGAASDSSVARSTP
jgi:thiol-disulfide isomerase/thioredoxin